MKQRTVLITGAAGFLGRYAVREFTQGGWHVVGIDDVPRENAPVGIEFHRMRLPHPGLEPLLTKAAPEACVHAAGRASVALSLQDPVGDFQDGVMLTLELLDALRRSAPHCRLILLSSAAVYGNPPQLPISECSPVAPLSPYGWHKRHAELLLEEFHRVYGLATMAVRIFSAYGPGLRRQVVWDICARALTTGRLNLHGSGAESRDFIHASDIARALRHLVESAPARGEVYNLATGVETTISGLATSMVEALGLSIQPQFDGQQTRGDPVNWRADVSRLTALGFTATVPLDHGLRDVAAWASAELAP